MEMRLGLLGKSEQAALEMSRNAQASGERGAAAAAAAQATGGKWFQPNFSKNLSKRFFFFWSLNSFDNVISFRYTRTTSWS